jgi:ribonuclease P protein component
LQLVAAPAQSSPGRVGYVIGKKVLRHAVDRNRVRRVLREAVRRNRPMIEAYDVIFRLKRGCARHEVSSVSVEAAELLKTLLDDDARRLPR